MKPLYILIAIATLASCATRQDVHVFNQGYSDTEVQAVVAALRESGFRPRPNALAVPDGIRASSIIYPPIVEDFNTVALLRDTLSAAGHPKLELIYETRGEHFYSTENIGLYLVNPDYTKPEEKNSSDQLSESPVLSHIYYSNCETVEAELSLFGQSTALLEVIEWSERTGRERSRVFDGQWSRTDSTLTFELFDEGEMVFGYSEFDGKDDYGRFYGIDLVSIENNSELATCDYRYVTYDLGTTLNRI